MDEVVKDIVAHCYRIRRGNMTVSTDPQRKKTLNSMLGPYSEENRNLQEGEVIWEVICLCFAFIG